MWIQNLLQTSAVAALCSAALASPLNKSRIDSEARWMVHLDVDALRKSALGDYLIKNVVNPAIEDADELKNANLSLNVTNISSITAYGPAFEKGAEGVLVISTSADVKKDLDTVAGMFLVSAGTNAPFTMVESGPLPLYSFSKTVFLAPAPHALLVAKSREQLERAHRVLQGQEKNLAQSSNFEDFREPPDCLLSVEVAEGFTGQAGIPVQAQVLKEARGGQICLGEKGENLFLNIVFEGKDEMASTRIQQVLQGIVALVSLSQDDKDITQLAAATRISGENGRVFVHVDCPVEKVLEKIKEEDKPKHNPHKPHKAKAKSKKHVDEDAPPAEPVGQPQEPALDKPSK